jgi:hypothetical protein
VAGGRAVREQGGCGRAGEQEPPHRAQYAVCVRPPIALLFEVMRADLSPISKIVAKFARPRSS